MGYLPIEDYGVIGDLETVALVGKNGSIDFCCFPSFDAPSIFCALLDEKKGGYFRISPTEPKPFAKQMYRPDSNVLLTRFLGECGICEISDFMHVSDHAQQAIIRRVKAVRACVEWTLEFRPRFNYARTGHRVVEQGDSLLFIPNDPSMCGLRLYCDVPLEIQDQDAVVRFRLEEGETVTVLMEQIQEPLRPLCSEVLDKAFQETLDYWQTWVSQSPYHGRWQEMVSRSALTLKMLTSKRHGSLVAAPTFGLPEDLGGVRNWDYRFTWIRDASFTLYALIRLGYTQEAGAFMHWIEMRCANLDPDGSLQIMYGIDGHKTLVEEELPHLEGYQGSRPVRIGNAAYSQLQLDIYGELMDSVYLYNKYGEPISLDLWANLKKLINWLSHHWREADEGIWEVRGGAKHFLYSRVMCWVAFDRAIRLAQKRSFPAPLRHWILTRDAIYRDILAKFWDPRRNAFMQYEGADALDASALLMPLVKFISPTDPRWLSTLHGIEQELLLDSLVYRYNNWGEGVDGLKGTEGTFNMCSFWYVECLARAGHIKQARFVFEKILGYANHLGLYAEETGPSGNQLGNFPQAFTHLALISAAVNLDTLLNKRAVHW